MNFEALENSIIQRLADNIPSDTATIIALPEKLADYAKPFQYAKVQVMFTGEKADDNQSTDEVSQHTTLTFNLSIQSRFLRGTSGIYAVSELVKTFLIGWRLADCGRMYFVSQDFSNADMDVWEHTLVFSARSLRVQQFIGEDYPDLIDAYPQLVEVEKEESKETIYQNS